MKRWAGLAVTTLFVVGCGAGGSGTDNRPLVVVTTTILGDVVSNIVGDAATVHVLMPVGTDPHDFEPSAQQAAMIREADLVVANGLGLEEGLLNLIETAREEGITVLELAPQLHPIPFADHSHEEEEESSEGEHGHGDEDPHFWQDPARMTLAVELIEESLDELEDLADDGLAGRAAAYSEEILEADAANDALLATIAPDQRKMVTNHEAFGYFADRYGFEIIGVVIPGGSTLAEPSAGELADLVEAMRHEGVNAIFAENTDANVLAEAVAAELGGEVVVVELFTDSLTESGTPASTYLGMIAENARLVAEALS